MQIGVQKQEILLTAHILSCILFFMSLVVFFSPDKAVSSGFFSPVLTTQSLLYGKCSQDRIGAGLRGSVLLGIAQPASHGRDERGPLPAAVLGQQEGHVAVGCQVFDCLVHNPRKAVKGNDGSGEGGPAASAELCSPLQRGKN